MKQQRVVCIGECMIEFSENGQDAFRLGFAGDTLNTAWYLRSRLGDGWHVDYCTAIGDDFYSTQMLEFFQANAIGTAHIRRIAGKRPGLYIIRQADGDRQFTYWRGQSAARQLADSQEFLTAAMSGAGLLYFSGITVAILNEAARTNLLKGLENARQSGAQIAFDPNIRPALWNSATEMGHWLEAAARVADFVLPSFSDERQYFGDLDIEACAARYFKLGAKEIAIKNGADGAYICSRGGKPIVVPARMVPVIDPTGAGDSFNAGYLASRIQGRPEAEAAADAHALASLVVQKPGALLPMEFVSRTARI